MIISNEVEIMTVGKSIKYYKNLGYECGYRTKINVRINDLLPSSKVKVLVKCDYCGKEFYASYCDLKRGISPKHACKACASKKAKEGNILKYGVPSYLSTQEGKKKYKKTCLDKYGVDNPAKSKEVQSKISNTNKEKYGVECVFQSEEIKSKIKNTVNMRYGVDNPQQSKIIQAKTKETNVKKYGVPYVLSSEAIQEKIKQTNLDKYGVESIGLHIPIVKEHYEKTMMKKYNVTNPSYDTELLEKSTQSMKNTNLKKYGVECVSKVPEVKEKIREAFIKNNVYNGIIPASKNQKYLSSLYNGTINYPMGYYFLDIYFPDDNIYCEYDGSGHDLNVKLNRISQKEFLEKHIIRYKFLKNNGLKLFRIIHTSSSLPSDAFLISIKNLAFEFLSISENNWIIFNLDEYTIKTKTLNLHYTIL